MLHLYDLFNPHSSPTVIYYPDLTGEEAKAIKDFMLAHETGLINVRVEIPTRVD